MQVVFLTALYYLLVASDSQYKPIEMVSFLSPGGGNTYVRIVILNEKRTQLICFISFIFVSRLIDWAPQWKRLSILFVWHLLN